MITTVPNTTVPNTTVPNTTVQPITEPPGQRSPLGALETKSALETSLQKNTLQKNSESNRGASTVELSSEKSSFAAKLSSAGLSSTGLGRTQLNSSSNSSVTGAKQTRSGDSLVHNLPTTHQAPTEPDLNAQIRKQIGLLEQQWRTLESTQLQTAKNLPAALKPLIEAQRAAQDLAFATQALSQCGEAVGGTLRKLQQLGGG